MREAPAAPRPGLRERKKARTRAAIREHALRLFREQGYAATTVDQIAEAADVSPSTFFRYFPTKEDVVLQDDLDVLASAPSRSSPPDLSPVAAFRAAARQAFAALDEDDLAKLRETARLTLTVPELRARAMDEYSRTIGVIAEAAAETVGPGPERLRGQDPGRRHRGRDHGGDDAVDRLDGRRARNGHVRPDRRRPGPARSRPSALTQAVSHSPGSPLGRPSPPGMLRVQLMLREVGRKRREGARSGGRSALVGGSEHASSDRATTSCCCPGSPSPTRRWPRNGRYSR